MDTYVHLYFYGIWKSYFKAMTSKMDKWKLKKRKGEKHYITEQLNQQFKSDVIFFHAK